MSPEIGTEVREQVDMLELGKVYEIVNVETVETEVRFLKGVRVEMLTAKAEEGSLMLWKRPVVGPKSKLGAFIIVLGSNTDKWLHKWIKFLHWGKQDNLIELVEAPAKKAAKTTTAKSTSKVAKGA